MIFRRLALLAVLVALPAVGLAGSATAQAPDPRSRYGPLKTMWTARTGWAIASKPAVGYGRVYIGSWDGYEYAFDQATGALRWRRLLGLSEARCPHNDLLGVTSSPALERGVAYLGGGDSNWYALDAKTGRVLWTVPTGDSSIFGGHYNWSSPVVYAGHAFIGIASHCDAPLVQGKLLRVNVSSRSVANEWKSVPDGQVGGTIWTSPVVDAERGTVFVTTGNRAFDATRLTQRFAEAMVALDVTTLAVRGSWSLPISEPTVDPDWGTSPTLFTDASGRDLVSAANKNGILYAFRRDDVSAGPVWSTRVSEAASAEAPGAGGTYSNGYFDGRRLYYAGGRTVIGGKTYAGSIRALDPGSGRFLWERPLTSKVYGALTGANGMVVVPSLNALYLVDSKTGKSLYAKGMDPVVYGAATVAGGRLFVGDTRGGVYAFDYPGSISVRAAQATGRAGAPAKLRFKLSRSGSVSVRVERISEGRLDSRRCVKPTAAPAGAKRCKRYVLARTIARAAREGINTMIVSRRMKPVTYRMTVTARDEAGNAAKAVRVVLRR